VAEKEEEEEDTEELLIRMVLVSHMYPPHHQNGVGLGLYLVHECQKRRNKLSKET